MFYGLSTPSLMKVRAQQPYHDEGEPALKSVEKSLTDLWSSAV